MNFFVSHDENPVQLRLSAESPLYFHITTYLPPTADEQNPSRLEMIGSAQFSRSEDLRDAPL
jgi:hypothetical protein